MLELQKFLFEKEPSRKELVTYTASKEQKRYQIQVYRNHSFELVEHTISAYLDYAKMQVNFLYSDYDDSLSFFQLDSNTDMLILWLDMKRYQIDAIEEFLKERLKTLLSIYKRPILCLLLGKTMEYQHVVFYDFHSIEEILGNAYFDERLEKISGTRLSAKACMMIAKDLGLRYLPALLKPMLKAIVVDLDHTLYRGILGEDGIEKIEVSKAYLSFQKQLKNFANQGFFICIASKNEKQDVEKLLDQRKDFLIKKEDFSLICASWEEKSSMIEKIADFLNIHVDSILFIDDNIGEILSVLAKYPDIHVIQASENPQITNTILANYPGLMKLSMQKEDQLRSEDIKENQKRQKIKQTLSKEAYLKSLQITLQYQCNPLESVVRISELANKTNQFIFSYKRYSIQEIKERMQRKEMIVIAVNLQDRLSDSGLIGVCVIKKATDFLILEECFISCRALGRGIEDAIVLGSISIAQDLFGLKKVKILFQKGERNTPAEKFLNQYAKEYINQEQEMNYILPKDVIKIEIEGIKNERKSD